MNEAILTNESVFLFLLKELRLKLNIPNTLCCLLSHCNSFCESAYFVEFIITNHGVIIMQDYINKYQRHSTINVFFRFLLADDVMTSQSVHLLLCGR